MKSILRFRWFSYLKFDWKIKTILSTKLFYSFWKNILSKFHANMSDSSHRLSRKMREKYIRVYQKWIIVVCTLQWWSIKKKKQKKTIQKVKTNQVDSVHVFQFRHIRVKFYYNVEYLLLLDSIHSNTFDKESINNTPVAIWYVWNNDEY